MRTQEENRYKIPCSPFLSVLGCLLSFGRDPRGKLKTAEGNMRPLSNGNLLQFGFDNIFPLPSVPVDVFGLAMMCFGMLFIVSTSELNVVI